MSKFISDEQMLKLEKTQPKKIISDEEMIAMEKAGSISPVESGARGILQGASLGFADEIVGGFEGGYNALVNGENLKDAYLKSRDESRANNLAAQEANPTSYTAGEVGGGVATAFVPGLGFLNAAKGAKAASVIGKAALQGGLTAAGSTNEDIASKAALEDIIKGTVIGGGVGAVVPGASRLVKELPDINFSKKFGDLGDYLKGKAEIQSAKAQGLERGTRNALNKGVSPSQIDSKVRAIGRQGLDEDVLGKGIFGNNAEQMIERNQQIKDAAMSGRQTAYDIIDSANASDLNPKDIINKIDSELGNFNKKSKLNSGKLSQLEDTLQAIGTRGDENISMNQAQELVEELRDSAKFNQNRSSPVNELAEGAYFKTRDMINEASERAGDRIGIDGLGDLIKSANKKYSTSLDADKLMANKLAQGANKSIGLTDTIVGVANPALLPFKAAWERGGNRAAAIGFDKLGDVLKVAPEKFGKFSGVLQNAAQRGSNSLGAAHFILQQNNPEYRQHLLAMQEEEK